MSRLYQFNHSVDFRRFLALSLFFFGIQALSSHTAVADIGDLSCCGVSSRFVEEANRAIHKVDYAVNDTVNQYVSLFNFDMGSDKFGVNGNASLGRLTAPRFDCHSPKDVLHSGIGDFGIKPRYLISAKLFGQRIDVVDASMQGAQGRGAAATSAARDAGIRLSVKIMGIEVINKSRKGPVTAARNPEIPRPSDLLSQDQKTGTGGKLLDISRSISESAGGRPIQIPIIPGLFLEFDAGFYLQTNLTFTYGVRSALMSLAGGGSVASRLGKNPANATDDYCEAAPDDNYPYNFSSSTAANTPPCVMKSSAIQKKGPAFYSDLGARVRTQADRFRFLREQIRTIKVKEFLDDAKLAGRGLGQTFTTIADPATSMEEKCSLLSGSNLQSGVRPFASDFLKIQSTYDNARGLINESTKLFQDISRLTSISENGFPEVTASAGIALDGRVGGWAAAVLALDFAIAKGWVGVRGYLTLIDIRMGLGASLSTKSQYLDLTSNLQQILLSGGIDAVWGVKIGVDPASYTLEGAYNLFQFPGVRSQNEWLVGRLDFRALTANNPKPPLFWCVNLFGNSVDPERCSDGDIANSEIIPGLAAHKEFREKYFNEKSLIENPACMISDGGKPVYTSDQALDCTLPVDAITDLNPPTAGSVHPLARYFQEHPEAFVTNLRDSNNKPIKVFTSDLPNGSPNNRTYAASSRITPPAVQSVAGQSYSNLQFHNLIAPGTGIANTSLSQKIMTISSRVQWVDKMNASTGSMETVPSDHNDPQLQVDLSWMSPALWSTSGWTSPNSTQNLRIYTGDLQALPNDILIEMAKNFKLGRCSASEANNEIYLTLSGIPYPLNGDTEGRASVNASEMKDSPCSMGDSTTLGKKEFAACMIREGLAKDECFPSSKVVSLVRLANLSNADVLAYFLAPNAPAKKISGAIFGSNEYWNEQYIEVYRDRTDLSTAIANYYEGRSCSVMTYARDDNPPEALSRAVPAWVQGRVWSDARLRSDNRALYLHWKPTIAYYSVGTADNPAQSRSIGIRRSQSTEFKNAFASGLTPPSNSKSNWNNNILCDWSNVENFDRYVLAQLPQHTAAAVANPNSGRGLELVLAIKDCVTLANGCVYTPDPDLSGNGQTIASTCNAELKKDGTSLTQTFPGASSSTSLSDCVQRSTDPNFSDANSFCNSPNVRSAILSMSGLIENPNTGFSAANAVNARFAVDAKWLLQQQVDSSRMTSSNSGTRAVGTCTLNHAYRSRIVEISGVNSAPITRNIASAASVEGIQGPCSLNIGLPGTSTAAYTQLRSTASDGIIDPTTSNLACWKSFGFEGTSASDQLKADGICNDLSNSPKLLISLLSTRATSLTSGNRNGVSTQLELLSKRNGVDGNRQTCTITRSTAEWKTIFNSGQCYLQLDPIAGVVGSTKLPLSFAASGNTTGETACLAEIANASTCARITSLPVYASYSPSGVRVSGYYADRMIRTAVNCTGNYNVTSLGGDTLTFDSNCGIKGDLAISSKGITRTNLLTEKAIKLPNASAVINLNSCHNYWQSSIQIPTLAHSQEAFCQRKLPAVYTALQNLSVSPLASNAFFNGSGVTSFDFTGANPLPGNGTTLPISISFASYFGPVASSSYISETTCGYGLRRKIGPSPNPVWELYTPNGQEVIEKTCIRETINNPSQGDSAQKCKTLVAGQVFLMGGAGPAYLADSPTDTFSTQTKAVLCSRYLPTMKPLSDLVQPDQAKRLPLYILRVDAKGNIAVPAAGSPPSIAQGEALFCSPSTCQLTATFGNNSSPIETNFLQNYGILSTSAKECAA
ncbi:MAG: hypothetical protein H7333_08450, partial [Bdellovibrionales bacterium]|nr:hypothetical protein [Oligoflexia bacterium]